MDFKSADSSLAFRCIIILLEIATQYLAKDQGGVLKEKKPAFVDKMLHLLQACVEYVLVKEKRRGESYEQVVFKSQ